MKTKIVEPQSEPAQEKKTMTRGKAIKKAGMVTLAASTMIVLLTSKKAIALSGPVGGGGSNVSDFGNGGDW